jgi:phage terminase Nu1 subunit (DNA packaging protein)
MAHEAMDIETVAGLLSVSTRQIRTYVAAGMPSDKQGRTPVFNWPDVLEWYMNYRWSLETGGSLDDDADDLDGGSGGPARGDDIRVVNLRRAKADASLKELQLSKLNGEVIVIGDAKSRLDRMFGNLRAKLLGMAPRLANRLEGEKDRTAREAALKEELENLCREISTGAIVGLPEATQPEVLDEVSAAAETSAEFQAKDFGLL